VSDDKLLRLLALVRRELSADDARVEIGGRPPAADGLHLWVAVGPDRRLVATFVAPPEEPDDLSARLKVLAQAFPETAAAAVPVVAVVGDSAFDQELAALCERAGACSGVVIDRASPVTWARSHPELGAPGDLQRWLSAIRAVAQARELMSEQPSLFMGNLDEAVRKLRERRLNQPAREIEDIAERFTGRPDRLVRWLRCGNAVLALSDHLDRHPTTQVGSLRWVARCDEDGVYARGLAGVYLLVLAFDGPLSEPRVEGAVRRATSLLERLIAGLPPLEPPPRGGLRLLRPE
jgi:hypothetical protein